MDPGLMWTKNNFFLHSFQSESHIAVCCLRAPWQLPVKSTPLLILFIVSLSQLSIDFTVYYFWWGHYIFSLSFVLQFFDRNTSFQSTNNHSKEKVWGKNLHFLFIFSRNKRLVAELKPLNRIKPDIFSLLSVPRCVCVFARHIVVSLLSISWLPREPMGSRPRGAHSKIFHLAGDVTAKIH